MKQLLIFLCMAMLAECSEVQETPQVNAIPVSIPKQELPKIKVAVPEVKVRSYDQRIEKYLVDVLDHLQRDDIRYEWDDYTSCNVGLFAQLITKTGVKGIKDVIDSDYPDYIKYADKNNVVPQMSWKNMAAYYCGITGKPIRGIIGQLQKAGFSSYDIANLEDLSDPYILSKTDIKAEGMYYSEKGNLIKYLKAWIDIIQAKQKIIQNS